MLTILHFCFINVLLTSGQRTLDQKGRVLRCQQVNRARSKSAGEGGISLKTIEIGGEKGRVRRRSDSVPGPAVAGQRALSMLVAGVQYRRIDALYAAGR